MGGEDGGAVCAMGGARTTAGGFVGRGRGGRRASGLVVWCQIELSGIVEGSDGATERAREVGLGPLAGVGLGSAEVTHPPAAVGFPSCVCVMLDRAKLVGGGENRIPISTTEM